MALSLYLDASVLVPLFTQDAFSARARAFLLATGAPLSVSNLATAEFASVISRMVRTGDVQAIHAASVFAALDAWKLRGPTLVETNSADFTAAEAMMRRLRDSLRTPDALHVAIVQRTGAELVTFDRRLARDAANLGVSVTEPA